MAPGGRPRHCPSLGRLELGRQHFEEKSAPERKSWLRLWSRGIRQRRMEETVCPVC